MAPPSSWNPADLPIMALKDRIVEKINNNRVSLIVGDTGCGKSSQIPQFPPTDRIAATIFATATTANLLGRVHKMGCNPACSKKLGNL
ncbi:hypothetical protein AMTR_s00053p00155720 [Amborella trichopoda]|uniref:Helicase ATP-binding domain-containing protein n=1 Tax=Amborella trichopoda TaxID=13333 RepID=W1P5C7_AMBTC|nr:hypothetical protein AMTR_s00053p00155720 [Amborella trichopoda]